MAEKEVTSIVFATVGVMPLNAGPGPVAVCVTALGVVLPNSTSIGVVLSTPEKLVMPPAAPPCTT